jgi:small subunit ribosomal protein S21
MSFRSFDHSPQLPHMPEIILTETDRLEWALKSFKKQVQKSGILRELRRRRAYMKPSEARQHKAKAARSRGRTRGGAR